MRQRGINEDDDARFFQLRRRVLAGLLEAESQLEFEIMVQKMKKHDYEARRAAALAESDRRREARQLRSEGSEQVDANENEIVIPHENWDLNDKELLVKASREKRDWTDGVTILLQACYICHKSIPEYDQPYCIFEGVRATQVMFLYSFFLVSWI